MELVADATLFFAIQYVVDDLVRLAPVRNGACHGGLVFDQLNGHRQNRSGMSRGNRRVLVDDR